jgi:type I restriction enzyme S subunit
MEVRPGYKQTEVGVIPTEWDSVAIADLVEPAFPICYGVVQVGADTRDGVPVVAIKYVKDIETAPLHRVSTVLERPYARSRIKGGDVLISIKGTIGRVGVVPEGFSGNISRELARLRTKPEYSAEYVAQQLEAELTQRRISQAVVGTTRLEFSIAALRKFKLAVPRDTDEQRAIAEALSDVDRLLGGLEQLITKKRDLKLAATQQLLTGQTRLPGFQADWEVRRLGELAQLYQPETIGQSVFTEDGFPVYGANGIIGRYSRYNHSTPQITISCRGNCGTVNRTQPFSWITGNAMVVNLDKNKSVDSDFMFQLLKSQDFSVLVTGSGQPQIVRGPLAGFQIRLPADRTEQTAIAAVLTDMDTEVAALEGRREKTLGLKQAMMQELLTGKTRLV